MSRSEESERLGERARAALVRATLAEIAALRVRSTPALRGVRRALSAKLRRAHPEDVKVVALALVRSGLRWLGCEVLCHHRAAMDTVELRDVEAFGAGMASWDEVDGFAVLLSGAAWLQGRIRDADVGRWARSSDVWWRRAALVSTVVLNAKSRGGTGDTRRTLRIARLLAGDSEDMVVKALSWALRSLVPWDPDAVRAFLVEHDAKLAARVKREVGNKLRTGLKSPKRGP